MANETMLPQLKGGAVVSIQLGSAFIAKIQECFMQHCEGHEKDMQDLKDRNGNYEKPLTSWENQALMYSSLLQEIMKTAEKDGLIEYISFDDAMRSTMPRTTVSSTPSDQPADSDQH